MSASVSCPKCGTTMDFRLGTYECADCGHQQAGTEEPAQASAFKSAARQNLDPTAAYQRLTAQRSDVAQVAAYEDGPLKPRERAKAADPLRGEKIFFTLANPLLVGGNVYYLLATPGGYELFKDIHYRAEAFDLSSFKIVLVAGLAVYVLLAAAALFFGPRWLKWLLALVATVLALGVIVGIVGPFNLYQICFSVPGFLLLLPSAWLLALLGRDIGGDVV